MPQTAPSVAGRVAARAAGHPAVRVLVAALAVTLARPATLAAQADSIGILKQPVFLLQPGLTTVDFLDAPAGVDATTTFNVRVVTAIPTGLPRTTLAAIVQFNPARDANQANFVYGPVVGVVDRRLWALDVDVLGAYGASARGEDRAYSHKLVLEGDLYFKVGRAAGWRGSAGDARLYAFFGHVATGLPSEASPWFLLSGVSIPVAPWRR